VGDAPASTAAIVLQSMELIYRPRPLQLTAGDEIVAMENMGILKANGFGVMVDEDQAPGRGERIKLSAMPVSKETVFDFKGGSAGPVLSAWYPIERGLISRPGTAPPPASGRG